MNEQIKKLIDNRQKIKLKEHNELLNKLLFIEEKMNYFLNHGYKLFNIQSCDNLELAKKIFGNAEQYSYGDEPYHWFHIKINKRGIKKLYKTIDKQKKIIARIKENE